MTESSKNTIKTNNVTSDTVKSQINIIDGSEGKAETNKKQKVKSIKESILKFLETNMLRLKNRQIHLSDFPSYGKAIRKSLRLSKSPKKKGFEKLLTDEERRSLNCDAQFLV